MLLLDLLLLLVPTGCSDSNHQGGGGCFAPALIGCAPPPASATGKRNTTAFRASLAPLLAALPSAAALRSQPDHDDRAHALGICFGGGGGGGGGACHACLWAAVEAAGEDCANDTRAAGVWSHDGCFLAYYAGGDDDIVASSSASDGGSGTRANDSLEQTLADLTKALAPPKGQSLWRKAQSIMLFVLAAIGTVSVVVLLCLVLGCYLLAETLMRNIGEAGPQQAGIAAAGQGEGLALYIAATNGQANVWSMTTQFRFH